MAFDRTCSKSKCAQKAKAMIEKTEGFFPVLTMKRRGDPGAHSLVKMCGRSTEMDMTFLGGKVLV